MIRADLRAQMRGSRRRPFRGLVGELRGAIDTIQFERALLEGIERVHTLLDSLDFRVPQLDTPAGQRRREKVEQIERDRPRVPSASTRDTVPREPDHLLAALAVKCDELANDSAL